MGGADDLRSVMTEEDGTLPIYLTKDASKHFKNILQYLFRSQTQGTDVFQLNLIKPYQTFQVGDMSIQPIPQRHGNGHSIGYRIGDFAYSTDVVSMDEKAFHTLEGIKVWVLGVVTPIANNKHINIETALQWIERIKPECAYFTHMGSRMDYDTLCRNLPDYIRPVYDGMEIDV
jgi:phosphoribosyl 1,2-cyclic phosphate phosphodiesterase